jgi:hypothetical protein
MKIFEKQTVIYDLGYSGHLAQILYINVRQTNTRSNGYKERLFTDNTSEEFLYLV